MKRLLSKHLIDQAKVDLKDQIISRIIKDANDRACWHLKSVDGSKTVDAVCYFRKNGTGRIFFKARRLVFELIKGDLLEDFAVYSNCDNQYCVNPDHHYSLKSSDYLKRFEKRSNYKHSPETIAKISQANLGKKASKTARLKMSKAKIGVRRNPELVARTAEKYFRGENNACAKLTEKEVLEIRGFKDIISSYRLAKHYPVTASHIRSIWRRSCWDHL
jgi:hypothetical protein